MKAKEYLSQAFIMEKIITSLMKEIEYWSSMAKNISNNGLEEHLNPNKPQNAPFVACLEKADEIRKEVEEKTRELMMLRKEIDSRIGLLDNLEEQLILRYRYLNHMSYRQIERLMNLSQATVYRIHQNALRNFQTPEV